MSVDKVYADAWVGKYTQLNLFKNGVVCGLANFNTLNFQGTQLRGIMFPFMASTNPFILSYVGEPCIFGKKNFLREVYGESIIRFGEKIERPLVKN